jgi:nucleotidyltransferase/DNA polymerase involved in DNA repair
MTYRSLTLKSIDEAVIDLTDTLGLFKDSIHDIGRQIKKRFREEIGEWMVCSIGVSTNRFLAKLAASLHKPDGLDTIDHTNVLEVYQRVKLLDLSGINTRFQARLNAYGIFTPIEFYNAPLDLLKKQVFQSILGYYWYLRSHMAKASFTQVGNCADSRKGSETHDLIARDTSLLLCYTSPARIPGAGEPRRCQPTTSRNYHSSLSTKRNGATK